MTAQDLEKLLAEVTPDWRPGGRFKAVISDGITGWDDTETVAGYMGHLVCESVNHPAIMELICMAPALARKVIAAEHVYSDLRDALKSIEGKPVHAMTEAERILMMIDRSAWEDYQ